MSDEMTLKASIDISLYPLRDEYIPAVADFIERISAYPDIEVLRNDLSTQLFGEFDAIMDLLKAEIRYSWEHWGKGVLVIKFLADDLRGLKDL
jgi:uncharacterized protein YqgV (UPF0045/DUF77 family)